MSDRKRIEQIENKVARLHKTKEAIDFKVGKACELLSKLETSEIQKLYHKVASEHIAPFEGEDIFYDGHSRIYLNENDHKEQNNNAIAWINFRYEMDWDKNYDDPNRQYWKVEFGYNGITHYGFDPRKKDKDEVHRILSTHSAIGTLIELTADGKFDGIIEIRENYRVLRELETSNKERKGLSEAIHLLNSEKKDIIDALLNTPGFQFDIVGDRSYNGTISVRTYIGDEDYYNAFAVRIDRVTPKMVGFTVLTKHTRWDSKKNEYTEVEETTEYNRFKRKENVLYNLKNKYQDYFIYQNQQKQSKSTA